MLSTFMNLPEGTFLGIFRDKRKLVPNWGEVGALFVHARHRENFFGSFEVQLGAEPLLFVHEKSRMGDLPICANPFAEEGTLEAWYAGENRLALNAYKESDAKRAAIPLLSEVFQLASFRNVIHRFGFEEIHVFKLQPEADVNIADAFRRASDWHKAMAERLDAQRAAENGRYFGYQAAMSNQAVDAETGMGRPQDRAASGDKPALGLGAGSGKR